MSRPRTYQTEAIVIKKIKLGEADRILTLYTPHLGKIRAVAKGVRRAKAKLAGQLEMLTHGMISLARGRNLDTIIGCQPVNSFISLKSDLWLAACGLYATELVEQFTADHVENYPLFQRLQEAMLRLCQENDNELTLRYFEVQLLNEVGYRPQLQQCVACHSPLRPTANAFCASAGGVLCPDCRHTHPLSYPLSVNALKVLRFFQASDYDTACRLRLSAELSREMEGVMRGYFRYLLEREIKSATWRDTLREQMRTSANQQAVD
ncbi:DNA repair protein RecO [Chloroflexota bacterium]